MSQALERLGGLFRALIKPELPRFSFAENNLYQNAKDYFGEVTKATERQGYVYQALSDTDLKAELSLWTQEFVNGFGRDIFPTMDGFEVPSMGTMLRADFENNRPAVIFTMTSLSDWLQREERING